MPMRSAGSSACSRSCAPRPRQILRCFQWRFASYATSLKLNARFCHCRGDRIDNLRLLADRLVDGKLKLGILLASGFDKPRQIFLEMAAEPEKYRHDAYFSHLSCDEIGERLIERGPHRLEIRKPHLACGKLFR